MGWGITDPSAPVTPPAVVLAVYYLVLPEDYIVLYSNELSITAPIVWHGDFEQFKIAQGVDAPLIPVDTHHALLLDWVDIDKMARNRPYLDDAIKAAIALVA